MIPETTEAEKIFRRIEKAMPIMEAIKSYQYIEYGKDFIRFKKEGGNVFEIKVREIKTRVKPLRGK